MFINGQIHHVFNRSIANYKILSDLRNCQRFIQALGYYNNPFNIVRLSHFLQHEQNYNPDLLLFNEENSVKFISYLIMPDHYHLLIKLIKADKFSKYIGDVENSFTKYFNTKLKRKGPLWESRFKSVRIRTDEQLLHTSRYIHLNCTTAGLVNKPESWIYSSYRQIISNSAVLEKILTEVSIPNKEIYRKFIEDRIDYQRKLKLIKRLLIDNE